VAELSAVATKSSAREGIQRGSLVRGRLVRGSQVRLYCLGAGLLDSATGVVLVAAPRVALAAMGVEEMPADLVLLRWIGAFVGAVGLCYLYPLVLGGRGRDRRLAVVLELTTIQRLVVFAFTTGALALGQLSPAWISVPFTDLALAAAQIWMLRSGWAPS
jgi:hypothetical protein